MDTSGSLPQINTVDNNSCDSCEMQDANEITIAQTSSDKKDDRISKQDPSLCINCVMCASEVMNGKDAQSEYQSLNVDSLALLVDLFYLPFEHGLHGHALLSDIKWLIDNSDILIAHNSSKVRIAGSNTKHNEDQKNDSEFNAEISMRHEGDIQDEQEKIVHISATSTQYSQPVDDDNISDSVSKNNIKLVESWLQRADGLNNLCERIRQIANTLIVSI